MFTHTEKLARFEWFPGTAVQPGDRVWVAVAYHASEGDIWEVEEITGATWWLRSVTTNTRVAIPAVDNVRTMKEAS